VKQEEDAAAGDSPKNVNRGGKTKPVSYVERVEHYRVRVKRWESCPRKIIEILDDLSEEEKEVKKEDLGGGEEETKVEEEKLGAEEDDRKRSVEERAESHDSKRKKDSNRSV